MNRELVAFVEHARSKGMDHSTIHTLLRSTGWKEKEIVEALAQTSLEMPIPAPPDTGGAREAFFHLLTFASLYAVVIGVVVLLFHYINRLFPDLALEQAVFDGRWQLSQIRWSLAIVLVSFPSFLWFSRFLLREMRAQPERASSAVRRWLTYLTLFAASLALAGDVMTLVFRLLEGELSVRFILKVAVVLLVSGMTFGYYFLSLRPHAASAQAGKVHRTFAIAASAIVGGTVIWGLVLAGSPSQERLSKLDARRVEDLKSIANEIATITLGQTQHGPSDERTQLRPIPGTLQSVADQARNVRPDVRDPATGAEYTYEVTGETRFRLCARFDQVRVERQEPLWNHPAGDHCFEFDLLATGGPPQEPR